MQFSDLSALSLSELKALATSHNAIPTGDKRAKQTWIDALELLVACETISDAQMECVAHVVSEAKIELDERLEQLDAAQPTTDEEFEAALSERECLGEVQACDKSDKRGATSVFASLLCLVILVIQAVLVIGAAIVQIAIHIKNLFGAYNPDYDMLGRLQDLARNRSLVPVEQS